MGLPVRNEVESDERLVERALLGDRSAYTALHRRHVAYVSGVVYRLLGQDPDLDDVVQETFVYGFRELRRLKDPAKLRAFLVTIAVRRVSRRVKMQVRKRAFLAELISSSPRSSNPSELEELRALCTLLGRCQAKHRISWVLHRVEGFTLPETAEATEASLASVKRWIGSIDRLVEALE